MKTAHRPSPVLPVVKPLSPNGSAKQNWLLGVLLVAAVIFAYQPAWNAGFIWDDDHYVTHNPLLTAPDGLQRIWFSTDSPSQYFPLVYTTFRIEHALWGLNASGYHWVNILLHAVNALLVWRLLARLKVPGAWLGAAIFALHPVQVESVAWITELKNVQSLFFFLLAALAWIEFVDDRPAWRWYALAIACHALALFSKTTACTFPAAQILILWLQRKPITGKRWLQVTPFVLMGLAMGLVSIWWERHHQGTVGDVYSMSWLERGLVASRAAWFYLGKILWPENLVFNYPLWKIDPANPLAYGWLAAGAALAATILFARRFVGRSLEVAAVFFLAMLSPLLGFVMLYTFKYTFVADHYQYVAMIGPAALIAAGIHRAKDVLLPGLRAFRPAIYAVLVAGLGLLTWRQSHMYENLETLWRVTIARNPSSYMGHNNLGAIHLGRGEIDEAIRSFERALEILPSHGNAYGNLGHALMEKGRIDDALQRFAKAVELEPTSAKARSDFGLALLQGGRVEEALLHSRKAVELEPDAAEAHNVLSVVCLGAEQIPEAIAHARRAIELHPGYAEAYQNLGSGLVRQGHLDDAIAHYQTALKLQPDFIDALVNLGHALANSGRPQDAVGYFQRALQLQPDSSAHHVGLGAAWLQIGRMEEAMATLRKALALDPNSIAAHHHLAIALFQTGDAEQALASFKKIADAQPDSVDAHYNLAFGLLQAGRFDEAIGRFETVLKLQPDLAMAHSNIALALLHSGRAADAVRRYQDFLKQQPDHPHAMSDLAWVLATSPSDAVRDGARAIELARRANEISGGENPNVLRALAAAYAEGGRFSEAVATARRGTELAEAQDNRALAEMLRAHLKTYETNAPLRDQIQAASPQP